MRVKLVSVTGPLQGTEIPIESDRVSIGRDPSNQIHIEDRLVSRRHCEIQRDGVTFHIKDLGSSNRTYVNDNAIGESRLEAKDKITIGSSLFIFTVGEEPQSAMQNRSTIVLRREEARVCPWSARPLGARQVG